MIKQLRIQNFKSLRDVTLDLQRVNLLIGPNNCGKTNVLKALKFFSEFLEGKYPSKKRLTELAYRFVSNDKFYVAAPFKLTYHNDSLFGGMEIKPALSNGAPYYSMIAGSADQPAYDGDFLDFESLHLYFHTFESWNFGVSQKGVKIPEGYQVIPRYEKGEGVYVKKDKGEQVYATSVPPEFNLNFYPITLSTFDLLMNDIVYRPDPAKLLGPYPVINEEHVIEDASNLVAFIQVMRNKYHHVYKRIEDDLQRFVPEFTAISFDIIEVGEDDPIRIAYPGKSYARLGLLDKHGRTFWTEDLSEGILYFLALLAIIHQPNPPKILLLEEPEKGIHPRRIREVLDLIFELAEEKDIQVIMTTHSPLVVDRFSDIPESVFILEKPENETIVKNLQRDVIEPMNEKFRAAGEEPIPFTESLGENWAMGFLGGVPHDRV